MDSQNQTGGNGETHGERPNGVQRISVSMDPHTLKLHVDLDCDNLDLALSILARAERELDARFRFVRAQELLAEKIENQRLGEIARSVSRGKIHV